MQRCNRHAFTLIKKYAAIAPASQRAIKAVTLVVGIGCCVDLRFATVAAGASPEYAFIVGVYVGLVCLFFTGELAVLFLSGALTPAMKRRSPGRREHSGRSIAGPTCTIRARQNRSGDKKLR